MSERTSKSSDISNISDSGGHLLVIGGGEDRIDDKQILERFVALAGGSGASIVVLTAASGVPQDVWKMYDKALGDLGATRRVHLQIAARSDADRAENAAKVAEADGVFITGGDQRRLLATIGGTAVGDAIALALRSGATVAGTSAGASAMSAYMLADGSVDLAPQKGEVNLGAGLGLLPRLIIDQHFSQRHRLARLLSVVAQNPQLQGVGIDEDTALVVRPGRSIEVIGRGSVTVLDARNAISNVAEVADHEALELIDVRMHLLRSGTVYAGNGEAAAACPPQLKNFLDASTQHSSPEPGHLASSLHRKQKKGLRHDSESL